MNRDEQVLKNLDLVESFLHDIIDTPSILGGLPDGTTLVLVPSDDKELADANTKAAVRSLRCPKCGSQMKPVGSDPERGYRGGVYLQPVCS
jgi:hypothetical protein